jgi:uncharacterized membrane protein
MDFKQILCGLFFIAIGIYTLKTRKQAGGVQSRGNGGKRGYSERFRLRLGVFLLASGVAVVVMTLINK